MAKQWDIFCRVIDNFGDVGVCWRLAADLAARGERVALWLDDARALAWMAPIGLPGISVHPWDDAALHGQPGDVVIEAFGCELPAAFVQRMACAATPPVWVNLEYLSAEPYVERSHRLPSLQLSGAGRGLTKWFFYPGFTEATGGLMREPGLAAAQAAFQPAAWLHAHGIERRAAEKLVSVFAYTTQGLGELLHATFPGQPTLLLLTAGMAEPTALPAHVRWHHLPYLSQSDYDQLLWCCDLNLVRGEDSFVRAQWAGRPFLWQIYPQSDHAHAVKLDAFFDLFLTETPAAQAQAWRTLGRAWNGLAAMPSTSCDPDECTATSLRWRKRLRLQEDLVTQLLSFVAETR